MAMADLPKKRLAVYAGIIVVGFGALAWGLARALGGDDAVSDDVQARADEIARSLQAHEPPPGTRPDELAPPDEAPAGSGDGGPVDVRRGGVPAGN